MYLMWCIYEVLSVRCVLCRYARGVPTTVDTFGSARHMKIWGVDHLGYIRPSMFIDVY